MTARPEITIIFLFLLKATMFVAPFLLRRHLFWSKGAQTNFSTLSAEASLKMRKNWDED